MRVRVLWNQEGKVVEEECDYLHGDEPIYLMDGTAIPMKSGDLFVPGYTLLNDDEGLWLLPNEDKISITPIEET